MVRYDRDWHGDRTFGVFTARTPVASRFTLDSWSEIQLQYKLYLGDKRGRQEVISIQNGCEWPIGPTQGAA